MDISLENGDAREGASSGVASATTNDANSRRDRPNLAHGDPVEAALASALHEAARDRQWEVVSQLARELEARRLAGG